MNIFIANFDFIECFIVSNEPCHITSAVYRYSLWVKKTVLWPSHIQWHTVELLLAAATDAPVVQTGFHARGIYRSYRAVE